MRKRGVRPRHLEQGCRQAVAVGHGGLLHRPPGLPGPQTPRHRTWELQLRLLAVTQRGVDIPHFVGCHFLRNLERSDVAGLLDHTLDGQRAVVVGVGDGEAPNAETTGPGFDQCLGLDAPGFKRHGRRDGFHGGAGLERVRQRPVAQLLTREVLPLVWHITRVVGECQHFARGAVQHHHTACLGLVHRDRITQLLVRKKLHLAVDAELHVRAVHRRGLFTHVFHHTAQPVLDHAPRPGLARQFTVEGQLHPFLAFVFHIGKTDHVGSRLALRVLAAVFLALVDALDAECGDFLAHVPFELALDPDKGFVFVFQFLVELGQRHFQQLGQLLEFGLVAVHIFRNGPDAGSWHAGRQDQAIAVQDAPPVGG